MQRYTPRRLRAVSTLALTALCSFVCAFAFIPQAAAQRAFVVDGRTVAPPPHHFRHPNRPLVVDVAPPAGRSTEVVVERTTTVRRPATKAYIGTPSFSLGINIGGGPGYYRPAPPPPGPDPYFRPVPPPPPYRPPYYRPPYHRPPMPAPHGHYYHSHGPYGPYGPRW